MSKRFKLTWSKATKRWLKRRNGRTFYLSGVREFSRKWDMKGYRIACERWGSILMSSSDLAKSVSHAQATATKESQFVSRSLLNLDAIDSFIQSKVDQHQLRGKPSASRVASIKTHLKFFKQWYQCEQGCSSLDEACIESYWKSLSHAYHEGSFSTDTFKGRWEVLKMFVKWCWVNRIIDELPRNLAGSVLPIPSAGISDRKVFSVEEVRSLFDAASLHVKTWIALACNCGFTQQDISDLAVEEVDWQEGRIIRKRSKTNMATNHKLWDLTLELMNKTCTTSGLCDVDGNRLVFGTQRGEARALKREELVDGKLRKRDAVHNGIFKLTNETGIKGSFKLFRKVSADQIKQMDGSSEQIVHDFLGHTPRTIADRHYTNRHELDKWLLKLDVIFNLQA